jgi:hypothetical protein
MNRLTPLVSRRHRPRTTFISAPAIAAPAVELQAARWLEDAKLFASGWVAGLIIFGTLIA